MSETVEHRARASFGAKGTWRMRLEPDRLVLAPAPGEGSEVVIPRAEVPARVQHKDPAVGGPLLVVRAPKMIGFRVAPPVSRAYAAWRGPVTRRELRAALRGLTVLAIPIGLLWMLGSAPLPADPAAGEPGVPLDVSGMVLGAGLVALGALRLFVLTRWLFALDAAWWAGVAVDSFVDVVARHAGIGWLAFTGLAALFAIAAVQSFRRFPPDRRLVPDISPASLATERPEARSGP